MTHAGINTAAVWIKAADDHVVEADECGEDAHRRDQPERRVTGDGESQSNHVSFASAPVAVQDRGRPFPIDIARTFNVCWDQILVRNETASRDERSHFSKHGFAPQLLLFNDADEVSCRAGATKCSRCRASFAPIRNAFARGIWFPRWTAYSAGPLSETKNWSKHLIESIYSQTRRG